MKKSFFILASFTLIMFTFSISQANATVGGPTFIYSFKYNPLDQSVYYIKTSASGRGCPPELIKISLVSNKNEVVYSCDDGEKLTYNTNNNSPTALTEIYKIIKDFKDLTPINLKTNKIDIDVNLLNYEKFNQKDDYVKNANFIASVYQNNIKLTDLNISGCNTKQPFTFAGYAIPSLNKKIVLLLSTKSDCFEGGYVGESLYVVGNINNLNRVNYSNFHKDISALAPNEETLVIFEPDKIGNNVENNTKEESLITSSKYEFPISIVVIIILISVTIGVTLGKLPFKKR